MMTFTVNKHTFKRFMDYSKAKSINKSAFIDRIINAEIDKEEQIKKK